MRGAVVLGLLFAALVGLAASAQPVTPAAVNGCIYETTPATLANLQRQSFHCDANGNLLTTANVSTTVSGFAPNGNYANLSVSNSTGNVALPAGAVVQVQNTGSTNAAYVNLGTSNAVTATTSQIYVPASSTIYLTVGANTYLAAITGSSTTTLTLAGGTGIGTGFGGGSSGGGGGAVTIADGADVTQGAIADAAWAGSGNGTLVAILKKIVSALGSPFQAGGSIGNAGFTSNLTQVGSGNVPSLGTGILGTSVAPTSTSAAGITPVVSTAAEANHQLCAAPCNFYSAYVTTGATAGYFMLANSTTAPTAGGAAIAPTHCIQVAANSSGSISTRGGPPDVMSTGAYLVFSSTGCFVNTASATAFFEGAAK